MIITNNYLANGKFCAFISEGEEYLIKPWPDEKGVIPRDMSLGYWDNAVYGRMHVYPLQMFRDKINKL